MSDPNKPRHRFELLEVDDSNPGRSVTGHDVALTEAEQRRSAAEVARLENLIRLEREGLAATERRSAKGREMTDRRRTMAKARRNKGRALDSVNEKINSLGSYVSNVEAALDQIFAWCEEEGFTKTDETVSPTTINGNVRNVYFFEDDEGKKYGLLFSTYKMLSSGRTEITAYLS